MSLGAEIEHKAAPRTQYISSGKPVTVKSYRARAFKTN